MVTAENTQATVWHQHSLLLEKRVGLCFIFILASGHIIKKCFALL